MTLSTTTNRVSYAGDGSTVSFSIPFLFLVNSHIEATLRSAAGVETTWTLGTQYSLTGEGLANGGTLTVDTSPTDYTPATGETLVIRRVVPETQETDYPEGGAFPASSHEQALDKLTMMVQQQTEGSGRAIKFSLTSPDSDVMFPDVTGNGSKVLRVKSDATGLEMVTIAELGEDATLPASSTDNAFVRFDGTAGTSFQNSGITGDDNDNITLPANAGVHLTEGTAPGTAANTGAIYTKDTGGQPELYFREESSGDEVQITSAGGLSNIIKQGKHTISVPAAAMTARTTNGAAAATTELATNDVMLNTFDFDATTSEGVQFVVPMPESWNEGTVTFIPYWTGAAGAGGVSWTMRAVALSNDDAMDAAFGTGVNSDDTFIAANDLHIGPESATITIAGTPAAGDLVVFEVVRDVADANDTKSEDAKLIAVKVLITLNAADDS